ncbi:MAG: glycosyltransferase, partial [Bacteroidota bacterium]
MNKRILFVDEDTGRTGSTVSMEYLITGFQERGFEVFVLSSKDDPVILARLSKVSTVLNARTGPMKSLALSTHFTMRFHPLSWEGITTIAKDGLRFLLGIAVVLRAIRTTRAQLVYANEHTVPQASVAAWIRNIPAVMHIRSRMVSRVAGIRRYVLSRVIVQCNRAIIAITAREAEQLQARPRSRANINVVGEFISRPGLAEYDLAGCRSAFGLFPAKRIVSMLGGIQDIKGSLEFLQAAEIVAASRTDVQFVIAGMNYCETPERKAYYDRCMEIVARLEQRGLIRMLGEVLDPLKLLAASDI